MITPDTNAIVRQPQPSRPATTTGCRIPPVAMPVPTSPSASPRRRRNQFTSDTDRLSIEPRLCPVAISANTT